MNLTFIRAAMFNKRAQNKADVVLRNLKIRKGDVIADIGSGGGFFTFKFMGAVGEKGKVFAVDTNELFLQYINQKVAEQNQWNVVTVLTDGRGFFLPEAGCDLIFFRNVFHHLPEPEEYFRRLKKSLKPEGRIAIIDYRNKKGFTLLHLFGHQLVSEEEICKIMTRADFKRVETFDFLPEQSFNIFALDMERRC
jgi:arsenite methyltransferase